MDSFAPSASAWYSASIVEIDTVEWRLLGQVIAPPASQNKYPPADQQQEALQATQSISINPSNWIEGEVLMKLVGVGGDGIQE